MDDEEDEDNRRDKEERRAPKAYDAEQEKLRRELVSAIKSSGQGDDDDDDDDVFGGAVRRDLPKDEEEEEGGADRDVAVKGKGKAKKSRGKKGAEVDDEVTPLHPYSAHVFFTAHSSKLANAYFGNAEDDADKFLRKFILNKGWVDKTEAANYVPSYKEVSATYGQATSAQILARLNVCRL